MTTSNLIFNRAVLRTKPICIDFLREFGFQRDWSKVKIDEMREILASQTDAKMFQAAQTIIERDGETFDASEFSMTATSDSDEGSEEDDTPPKPAVKTNDDRAWNADDEARLAAKTKDAAQAEAKAAKAAGQAIDNAAKVAPKPTVMPKLPPSAKQGDHVKALSEALAALVENQNAAVDPAQVEAIAQQVFQDKSDAMWQNRGEALWINLKRLVTESVAEAAKLLPTAAARELIVKTPKTTVKIDGLQHREFETLLHTVSARNPDGTHINAYLFGPPGTGKTTAASNAAKALGVKFYATGALLTKYDLTGYMTASGKYLPSLFRQAYEHGGLFLFDEMDGSAAQALVAFNQGLANTSMAFPDGMVDRHTDNYIVGAGNTNLMGATAAMNGRQKGDDATADRFAFLEWGIDEKIEEACASDKEWFKHVQRVRRAVQAKGIKGVQISPRATIAGCALLAQGLPRNVVERIVLKKGMSDEQWAMVI